MPFCQFFRHSFQSVDTPMVLRPGTNHYVLKTTVGALVGSYHVNQLSVQVLETCELLSEKWPGRKLKYAVITEPHSFEIVYPEGKATLWAGFPQPIDLHIFTGSHQLSKVKYHGLFCKIGKIRNSDDSDIPYSIFPKICDAHLAKSLLLELCLHF